MSCSLSLQRKRLQQDHNKVEMKRKKIDELKQNEEHDDDDKKVCVENSIEETTRSKSKRRGRRRERELDKLLFEMKMYTQIRYG